MLPHFAIPSRSDVCRWAKNLKNIERFDKVVKFLSRGVYSSPDFYFHHIAVADPGFPVGGGRAPIGGAWTTNVGTFQ